MRLGRVCPRRDDLRCRLAGDRPVQLVLHRLEEGLRDLGVLVVVDAALLVDVGDLEVEAALAGADLADALEQLVEVVLAEARALLEPLVVQHESLDDELLQRLRRPDAELRGLTTVDPVPDRDDRVEVVELGDGRLLRVLGGTLRNFRRVASSDSSPDSKMLFRCSLTVRTSTPNSSAIRLLSQARTSRRRRGPRLAPRRLRSA